MTDRCIARERIMAEAHIRAAIEIIMVLNQFEPRHEHSTAQLNLNSALTWLHEAARPYQQPEGINNG